MNYSFFLIPFLLIVGVGICQDVSALETITGYDYFDTDNGDGTRTWSTHEPYVFDGNNWVPYINSGLTTQNHFTNVTLNNDGSYTFAGKFTDKIVVKYADVSDLNNWTYLNSINNDAPDVSWNGNEFVSRKQASAGIMDYKYVLVDGKWKTQLEATNLSALTTKVFGFDQIIDLESDSIRFGGVTRNLDNFDAVTFDKAFLVANQGKILDLLNGVIFDFDLGFENLYSITVYDTGVNSSRLIFDYRTSVPLLPNETLIIDPTILQNVGGVNLQIDSLGTNGHGEIVTATSALLGVTIEEVSFWLIDAGSAAGTLTFGIWDLATNTLQHSFGTLDASTTTGVMTKYTRNTGSYLMQTDDIFGVKGGLTGGFIFMDGVGSDQYDGTNTRRAQENSGTWTAPGNTEVRFEIIYNSIPAPDSITDLTADSVETTTATLSFTPPNLNGETLINYMLNVTTPQQATPPTTFWMNGSASPFSVVGLTAGTDYSASASAYTAGGGNWALANVLNFTTLILPSGILNMTTSYVGDAILIESSMNLTQSIPLPANVTALKLYRDNSLVKTDSIFVSISALNIDTVLDDFGYQITDGSTHEYALAATVENTAGSIDIISIINATIAREYDPNYFIALDPTEGLVNYTFVGTNTINVNRDTSGSLFNIECAYLSQAQAFFNEIESAAWDNKSNVIFYEGDTSGYQYIACFNDGELFAVGINQSYSNALVPGLLIFDQLGGFFGAPAIILVILSILSLGTGRNYPIILLIAASVTGILLALELLTLDPGLVVALIVMTGFGLFGIRKFY